MLPAPCFTRGTAFSSTHKAISWARAPSPTYLLCLVEICIDFIGVPLKNVLLFFCFWLFHTGQISPCSSRCCLFTTDLYLIISWFLPAVGCAVVTPYFICTMCTYNLKDSLCVFEHTLFCLNCDYIIWSALQASNKMCKVVKNPAFYHAAEH